MNQTNKPVRKTNRNKAPVRRNADTGRTSASRSGAERHASRRGNAPGAPRRTGSSQATEQRRFSERSRLADPVPKAAADDPREDRAASKRRSSSDKGAFSRTVTSKLEAVIKKLPLKDAAQKTSAASGKAKHSSGKASGPRDHRKESSLTERTANRKNDRQDRRTASAAQTPKRRKAVPSDEYLRRSQNGPRTKNTSDRSRHNNSSDELLRNRRATAPRHKTPEKRPVDRTNRTAELAEKTRSASHSSGSGFGTVLNGIGGAASALLGSFFGSFGSIFRNFLRPMILIPAILKWAAFAGVLLVIVRMTLGSARSSTSFDTMEQIVMNVAELTEVEPADNLKIRRLYGINAADCTGVKAMIPTSNMGARELCLIQAPDDASAAAAYAAMQKRLESQLASFNGYGVDQTAMLEKSIVLSEGGYVIYYSGDHPDRVESAFRSAL